MKNNMIYLLLTLAIFSCDPAKRIAKKNAKMEVKSDENCRFSISFISIGGGTDGDAKKQFETYIVKFDVNNNTKLDYETVKWGREGEVDYCFKLSELKPKQQEIFISDLKELLKDSKLVRYQENEPCKKGRQN
jgi:hypothetical protein